MGAQRETVGLAQGRRSDLGPKPTQVGTLSEAGIDKLAVRLLTRRDIHNGFSKLVGVPRALGMRHRVASTALAINLIRSSRAALIPSMRDPFTTPVLMVRHSPLIQPIATRQCRYED
jgi:hypothetical protein